MKFQLDFGALVLAAVGGAGPAARAQTPGAPVFVPPAAVSASGALTGYVRVVDGRFTLDGRSYHFAGVAPTP